MFVVFGFAAFGALGMTEAMERGHGFCFAASAGPFCPEAISAFISHLSGFQKLSVSVLQEICMFAFAVLMLCVARRLLRYRAYLRFIFSFPSRRFRKDFLLRFVAAKEKFLSWLTFHEQSPAVFTGA